MGKEWFKAKPVNNLTLEQIRQNYGLQGVGAAYIVQGMIDDTNCTVEQITPELVKKWTGLKLKTIQSGLFELLKEFCFGFKTVSNSIQNGFKSISKSIQSENEGTSNPHGSTRDLEEKRIDKNREEISVCLDQSSAGEFKKQTDSEPIFDFEERSPVQGPEFTLVQHGKSVPERKWVTEWLQKAFRGPRMKPLPPQPGWESLIMLDPTCLRMLQSWSSRPLAERMAACAYAARSPSRDNQLAYAIKCVNKPNAEMLQTVKYFETCIESGDYTVELE